MRLANTKPPIFKVWLPRTNVMLSPSMMSVVGETSERAAPAKLAKPVTAVSGIEFSYLPPLGNSWLKVKLYVSRFQKFPDGGICCETIETFVLASLMKVGEISQVYASWYEVPGRKRLLGLVGNCDVMKVP